MDIFAYVCSLQFQKRIYTCAYSFYYLKRYIQEPVSICCTSYWRSYEYIKGQTTWQLQHFICGGQSTMSCHV